MDNKDKLIELYTVQKIQGRDFSEIRKELAQKGISDDDIRLLIKRIDEKVLKHELNKTKAKINKQILYFGIFLIIFSIIFFILRTLGFIQVKNDLMIYTTAIIAGTVMVVYSLLFSNKPRVRKNRN